MKTDEPANKENKSEVACPRIDLRVSSNLLEVYHHSRSPTSILKIDDPANERRCSRISWNKEGFEAGQSHNCDAGNARQGGTLFLFGRI